VAAIAAEPLADELLEIWRRIRGAEPGPLGEDLNWLGIWFDPLRSGEKIRSALEGLPEITASVDLRGVADPVLVQPIERTVLVTPEGRLAIRSILRGERLDAHLTNRRRAAAQDPLLGLYQGWSHAKLLKIAATLAGEGDRMFPVAIAATAIVLAHGARDRESALVLPRDRERNVDAVLREMLDGFANRVGERVATRATADFDGYPLSKAKERLGRLVRRERPRGGAAAIWVEDADREAVVGVLASEISRRPVTSGEAIGAVRDLIGRLVRAEPELRTTIGPPAEGAPEALIADLTTAISVQSKSAS
jgi:hypothetical protein